MRTVINQIPNYIIEEAAHAVGRSIEWLRDVVDSMVHDLETNPDLIGENDDKMETFEGPWTVSCDVAVRPGEIWLTSIAITEQRFQWSLDMNQ